MRHGFFTGRLVGSQAMLPGLAKMNNQGPLFVGIDMNLKHFSVYSLNPLVLCLYIKWIKGKIIDHDYYIDNCLIPVINEIRKKEKSPRTTYKILHDNGPPSAHRDVVDYLTEQRIEIIPHPPYSPNLAPCDFWLNDYIKNKLTDHTNEESLAEEVSAIMKNIPINEFKKTFDKLLERMQLCIENNGDYFEHLIK